MRKPVRYFLIISTLFLFGFQLQAAVVEGVVSDTEGNPLSNVNVVVEGLSIGTATNNHGYYGLRLSAGSYRIQFSSLGYKTVIKEVTVENEKVMLNVTLSLKPLEMMPVVVTSDGKDPAYWIIDQVIANKEKYLNQYQGYERETYRKISLEKEVNDTTFTYRDTTGSGLDTFRIDTVLVTHQLIEVLSKSYFQKPDKIKEIKQAYRDRSSEYSYEDQGRLGWDNRWGSQEQALYNPYLFAQNQASADLNFYENLLNIPSLGQVPYLSPVAGSAMLSYKYRLVHTFMEDSLMVHEIEVTPRRRDGALFRGTIYIVEELWAIKAVDFTVDPATLDFFKTFSLFLDYDLIEDSIWVVSRENYHYTVKDGRRMLYGNSEVLHSDYTINPALPANFFRNEVSVTLDDAYDKDSTFWQNVRPVKLKPTELNFLEKQDSILTYRQSAEYLQQQDSIYNRLHWLDFILFGIGHRNTYNKFEIYINPLVASVRPLWIGGYRHALGGYFGKEFARGHNLNVAGEIDYNYLNDVWKGRMQTSYLYNPKKLARFQVKYGSVYSMVNTYESIIATFGGGNYVNEQYYGIGHEYELVNGIYLDAEMEYAERWPLGNIKLSKWSELIFGEYNQPVDFDPYDEFLVHLRLRIVPFQKYFSEPYKKVIIGSDWPTFRLAYKKAVPGILSSDTDFDMLQLTVEQDLKVGAFGDSKWRLSAGTFLNSKVVEVSDYKYFRRSDIGFFSNPLNSMQLLILNDPIFTDRPFLQGAYLHRFNGTITNKIPLVRRLRLSTMVGAGFLALDDKDFLHAEIFGGLERPFRIRKQLFRIGVYYVTSRSNLAPIDGAFKIGIGFYNAFKGEWDY